MKKVAADFFDACETGKGWAACKAYCTNGATFESQAEPLAEIKTLEGYTNWMQGMLKVMPDGRYETKAFAVDEERDSVSAFAVFTGTHTGQGGPEPPTGKRTRSDYVYVMRFTNGKISHMTKIWNAGWAMRELGWA